MSSGRSTLILGGARSGKSRRAIALAGGYTRRTIIATAESRDAEMAERIAAHQAERDSRWRTLEEPLDIADVLAGLQAIEETAAGTRSVVVIDCLTLWLSNLTDAGRDAEAETSKLLAAMQRCPNDVILISNEVGLGIVPATTLGRAFRDQQGRLNQRVAETADVVEFIAAGLPLRLKP